MSSETATVEINTSSKESIFEGNLLKAPPLNRRGRKVRLIKYSNTARKVKSKNCESKLKVDFVMHYKS